MPWLAGRVDWARGEANVGTLGRINKQLWDVGFWLAGSLTCTVKVSAEESLVAAAG